MHSLSQVHSQPPLHSVPPNQESRLARLSARVPVHSLARSKRVHLSTSEIRYLHLRDPLFARTSQPRHMGAGAAAARASYSASILMPPVLLREGASLGVGMGAEAANELELAP